MQQKQRQRVSALAQWLSMRAGTKKPNCWVDRAIIQRLEPQGVVDSAIITPGWVMVQTICSNDEVPYFPVCLITNVVNLQ